MPQAILGLVGTVGGWLISGTVAVFGETAALAILDFGAKLAGLQLLGWISGKLTNTPDVTQTAVSQSLIARGTIEHQRIIYGEVLVGGTLVYFNSAGTHNQSLYHAVSVANHEINDITNMWVNDTEIPEAAIDWAGNGSVDSGWLAGDTSKQTTTYFNKYLGTDNQSASSVLQSAFSEITSQHQGRNIAYFVSRFDFFEGQTQVWSGGAPDQIRGLVQGKLVYDPRSDSTQSFGTGPHRVDSSPTWEYSSNPALCWADYLIDSRLGMAVDPSKVDYGYVASAANVCDGVVYTPVGTDVRFSCNGVLFTSTNHKGNIESILSSFNGSQSRVNGQYKVRAFAYCTPTLQFSENELRKDAQLKLDPDENDRFNTVRGVFIDKDRQWQSAAFPAFTSSEYQARDGGVKYEDIQLPMTTDIYMAQRLAAGVLERSNMIATAIYPSNFKTMPAEINGTLMLSLDKMSWTDKEFRVLNYGLEDMQGVNLTLREDSVDAYTDVGTAEYTVSSQGSYVTADPGVPAPTSFYINQIAEGTHLFWTPPPGRLYEYTEIWRNTVNSFGNSSKVYETRADNYIDDPVQGQYYYHLRAKNVFGEVSSPTSGVRGIFIKEAALTGDPGFELTPINTWGWNSGEEPFWSGVNTSAGPGTLSSAVVQSLDLGVGGTHTLHYEGITAVNTGGAVHNFVNNKISSIVRGLDLHLWMKYRVPVFSNISSAFIDTPITGRRSVNSAGGTMYDSVRIPITNSTGWQVYSDSFPIDTMTNVQSYSLLKMGFQVNQYATATDTGTLEIDFDELFIAYKGARRFQEQQGYTLTEIAGTISGAKLALDYQASNKVVVPLDATINSITIENWPTSGTGGEMDIAFVRSGTSTGVVNTDAWPSNVHWNGGTQLVVDTNSGGIGRVFLSSVSSGSILMADKADSYGS